MITQERLKELLHYDPETGLFTWAVNKGRAKKGQRAGSLDHGYRVIMLRPKKHPEHQLAFLYMTGSFVEEVDHINLNKADNRWINLRSATRAQNCANIANQKNNTSGHKGVIWHKGAWCARIGHNKKKIHIGYFKTIEEAALAYLEKSKELFGDFARAGQS